MDGIDWSRLTNDQVEQVLVRCEANIAAIRAVQAAGLAEADRRQLPTADGSRSLREWTAGRLDVSHSTATDLARMSRSRHPRVRADLASGGITFERAVAETRLAQAGATEAQRQASRGWDIAGVFRLAGRRRRMSKVDEREAYEGRYFFVQTNLDSSRADVRMSLFGVDAEILRQAAARRADQLPDPPDGRASRAQRMADGLVSIAQDSLGGDLPDGPAGPGPIATVMVDAALAAATRGEAGAEIPGGTRIGPNTLEEILCDGRVEVNVTGARPLGVGPLAAVVSGRLRRHVVARDGGVCSVAGCNSGYRLQVHHIVPRSLGGTNDPENLCCLCWYHHHVVVHGSGYRIDPDSPPQRRRLLAPAHVRDRSPPRVRG